MNYQPLFDLMSQHGLTLLEGEMDEIVYVVNKMHQLKPKKLTYTEFERLVNISPSYPDMYDAIFHYLADEQPATIHSLPSIDKAVNAGFRKATFEGYNYRRVCKELDHDTYYSGWMDCYDWISHQLARTQFTSLGSTTLNPPTKPEPSRLEVAAMILPTLLNMEGNRVIFDDVKTSICIADELIKQAKA